MKNTKAAVCVSCRKTTKINTDKLCNKCQRELETARTFESAGMPYDGLCDDMLDEN